MESFNCVGRKSFLFSSSGLGYKEFIRYGGIPIAWGGPGSDAGGT
jgi:hypothetical protein